ncbi:vitamin K epoxide reductase complex subunit 1-like [Eriocheir sinensis]|uniref:vitamin K epoxide reductase complex subunit 1-like n=1 Tax=Eriocheir sinensis TaxID=95602 RepID=UPI0021C9D900|nr:vitamin K epoxide reductase complex subunit 1-like [Eriocheir sinensis]
MGGQGGAPKAYQKIRYGMMAVSCVGIMLSTYALHVEVAKETDKSYQAMCDISTHVSCSKVFTSRYGRGFGLIGKLLGEDHILNQPNSIFGILFYCIVIILGEAKSFKLAKFQFGLVASSNFMSMYLAYLLYFVLSDFCLVCVSTYIVNIFLTVLAFKRLSALQRIVKVKSK